MAYYIKKTFKAEQQNVNLHIGLVLSPRQRKDRQTCSDLKTFQTKDKMC